MGISTEPPHPQDIFDGEHDHREDVEDLELDCVALGERGHRIGGEGDGIEDDEDDDERVDQPPGWVRIAADLEEVVDLAPPAPPGGRRRHALGAPGKI